MKPILISIILLLFLAGCQPNPREKTIKSRSGGMEYEQLQTGVGDPVRYGNWLKMQVTQSFNDSLLRDTRKGVPQYQRYDSSEMTLESLRIFENIREGDSLEFRVRADSAFGSNPPPFAQKGGYLITRVKVEKIIRTEEEFRYDTAVVNGEMRKKYEAGVGY